MTDKPKRILLAQDGCSGCEDAKTVFAKPIKDGDIEIVDVYTDRGQRLAEKAKAKVTPTFIEEAPDGSLKHCEPVKQDDGTMSLTCDIKQPRFRHRYDGYTAKVQRDKDASPPA